MNVKTYKFEDPEHPPIPDTDIEMLAGMAIHFRQLGEDPQYRKNVEEIAAELQLTDKLEV